MSDMRKPSVEKPWLKYYPEKSRNVVFPERTIYNHLKELAQDRLDRPALHYYGREFSFGELIDQIDMYANSYAALGVKPGDIVSFCTVGFPEIIASFYALNKLGATANFIDPRYHAKGIKKILDDAKSDILVMIDIAYPKFKHFIHEMNFKHVIVQSPNYSLPSVIRFVRNIKHGSRVPKERLFIDWKEFVSLSVTAKAIEAPYVGDATSAIVYTGGTTGTPKGVMLTNDSINTVALNFLYQGIDYNYDQCFLNIMPIFSSFGIVCGIHMPLTMGVKVIIIPQFQLPNLPKIFKKYKPNHMIAVPAFYEAVIESKEVKDMDLSFFLMAGSGGDTMNGGLEQKLLKFFKEHNCKYPLAQGYGMSEVSAAASFCFNNNFKSLSVGLPSLTTTIGIFRPGTTEELGYNEQGEICIAGKSLMKGYYNNQEETDKVLIKHPDGQLWVHSGDIGHIDEDGFLFIDGRVKQMVTRFDGHKVFPSHIEDVLTKHDSIASCAVVGIPDRVHGQGMYPLALMKLTEEAEATADKKALREELMAMSNELLEERGRPIDIVFIDEMPRTGLTKVDYMTLSEQYKDHQVES